MIQPELQRMIIAIVAIMPGVSMIMGAGMEHAGRQPVGTHHQPVPAGWVGWHESGWTDQLDQHGEHCQTIHLVTPAAINGGNKTHALYGTAGPAA